MFSLADGFYGIQIAALNAGLLQSAAKSGLLPLRQLTAVSSQRRLFSFDMWFIFVQRWALLRFLLTDFLVLFMDWREEAEMVLVKDCCIVELKAKELLLNCSIKQTACCLRNWVLHERVMAIYKDDKLSRSWNGNMGPHCWTNEPLSHALYIGGGNAKSNFCVSSIDPGRTFIEFIYSQRDYICLNLNFSCALLDSTWPCIECWQKHKTWKCLVRWCMENKDSEHCSHSKSLCPIWTLCSAENKPRQMSCRIWGRIFFTCCVLLFEFVNNRFDDATSNSIVEYVEHIYRIYNYIMYLVDIYALF